MDHSRTGRKESLNPIRTLPKGGGSCKVFSLEQVAPAMKILEDG